MQVLGKTSIAKRRIRKKNERKEEKRLRNCDLYKKKLMKAKTDIIGETVVPRTTYNL